MNDGSCLFCSIAAGEIPATLVHEGEEVVAFRDIRPEAPTHVLIIPRRHIPSVTELESADADVITELILTAKRVAREEGVADSGFRLVLNAGPAAGQSVDHLHLHVLGGRDLSWPPG